MGGEEKEPDIMTWFPRREDYEEMPVIVENENIGEKVRLLLL